MKKTYVVVCCGMLAAIGAILGGPLGIKAFTLGAYSLNISFGLVPGMFAGILFSPLFGFLTGAVTDLIKFLISTSALGGYDPVFTISFALMCMIPGLILSWKKTSSLPWLFLSVFIAQLVGSIGINSLWMVYGLGIPAAALVSRFIATAILIPCNTAILFMLLKSKNFILARAQK